MLSGKTTLGKLQKYTWPFTILVAVGGLWLPRLGLLVIPIMLSLITMSFFRGRYWCGNVCSHGSLFEYVLGAKSRRRDFPKFVKSPWFIWGVFLVFGFNIIRRLVSIASLWGTSLFWDRLGYIFVVSYLMVMVVGGVLAVFIRPRVWCSFCPMATMQKLAYKFGKLTGAALSSDRKVAISDPDKCRSCGKCAKVCPMGLSPHLGFADSNYFESEECIRCGKCVQACPFKLLSITDIVSRDEHQAA